MIGKGGRILYRRFRDYYDGSDNVTRVVAFAALLILAVITIPTFGKNVPFIANGVSCGSLSNAPGNGSNQSVNKPDGFALRLELLTKEGYSQAEPFQFDVRFTNDSMAPMVLAFVPEETVFRWSGRENGLSFWVQNVQNGLVLGETAQNRPPAPIRQQYTTDTIRWLMPHQRCTQSFTIDSGRVQAAGVRAGQYRVAAVYRNTQSGALSPIAAGQPTPIFRDQGVWVTPNDGVKSNVVILTVQ